MGSTLHSPRFYLSVQPAREPHDAGVCNCDGRRFQPDECVFKRPVCFYAGNAVYDTMADRPDDVSPLGAQGDFHGVRDLVHAAFEEAARLLVVLENFTHAVPAPSADGLEIEVDVFRGVFGIGEHDDPVVEHHHAAVVRRHDLLEIRRRELAAQHIGNLGQIEDDLVDTVDADHRGQPADRHVGFRRAD